MCLKEMKVQLQKRYQEHGIINVISVINRHQSDAPPSPGALPGEEPEDGSAVDITESPGKGQTDTAVVSQNRCPHHPHVLPIRFDPVGQASYLQVIHIGEMK